MDFATDEQIRIHAYHLWEANGRPDGRDLEFWERAQQSLANGQHQTTPPIRQSPQSKTRSRAAAAAEGAAREAPPRRLRRNP